MPSSWRNLSQTLIFTLCRYDAGAKDYWMSDSSLTAIEFLVIGNLELKRYEGWKEHKTVRAWSQNRTMTTSSISIPKLTQTITRDPVTAWQAVLW